MIKSVTVTNYLGESIKLDLMRPEKSGFIIKQIDGLGPSKADIHTTEVSTTDGGMFNSARKNKKNIVLYLIFVDNGDIESVRQKSYKYFPIKKPIRLVIETDNRTSEIEGYVESNEPSIFSKQAGTQISIVCPNPNFYSAGSDGVNTTIFSGVEKLFEFSFSNESLSEPVIEFGAIQNKTEQVVRYTGDAETGITIQIHALGTVENITIYNVGTREIMKIDTTKLATLTGSTVIAGDDITICTIKGKKSATLLREGDTINILNCLAKGTDWFELVKGDNIFAYTAETGASNLQFKIENRVLYEGV